MTDNSEPLFGLLVSIVDAKREEGWEFSYWETRYLYLCNAVLRCSLDDDTKECEKCRKNLGPPIQKILRIDALHTTEGMVGKPILLELVEKIKELREGSCWFPTLQELNELLIRLTNFQVTFKAWAQNSTKKRKKKKRSGRRPPPARALQNLRLEQMLLAQYKTTTSRIQGLLKRIKTNYAALVSKRAGREPGAKDVRARFPPAKKVSLLKLFSVLGAGLLLASACPVGGEQPSLVLGELDSLAKQDFLGGWDYSKTGDVNKLSKKGEEGSYIKFEADQTYNQNAHLLNGEGEYVNSRGTKYVGPFKSNLPHGEGGRLYRGDTLIYQGAWRQGVPEGQGTIFKNGKRWYEGPLHEGKPHGEEGTQYSDDGLTEWYKGVWKNGQWHGKGRLNFGSYDEVKGYLDPACTLRRPFPTDFNFYEKGETYYKGNFNEGLFDGKGELKIAIVNYKGINSYAHVTYDGHWENGTMQGEGSWKTPEGTKWDKDEKGTLKVYFKKKDGWFTTTELVEFRIEQNGTGTQNKLHEGEEKVWKFQQGEWTPDFQENGYFEVYAQDGKMVANGNVTGGTRTGNWTLYDEKFEKSYEALYDEEGTVTHVWDKPISRNQVYSGGLNKKGQRRDFGFVTTTTGEERSTQLHYWDQNGNSADTVYWSIPQYKRAHEPLRSGMRYRRYDRKEDKWTTVRVDDSGNEEEAVVSRPQLPLPEEAGGADTSQVSSFPEVISIGEYKWKGLVDDNGQPVHGALYTQEDEKVYEGVIALGPDGEIVRLGCGMEYATDPSTKKTYLSFRGSYAADGRRDGQGEILNSRGAVIFRGDFREGRKEGECTEYDDHGRLVFQGTYENGQRHGDFKKYDGRSGLLVASGELVDGKMEGEGRLYQENLGWIHATWSGGNIDVRQPCYLHPKQLTNPYITKALEGPLEKNEEGKYSLVNGGTYKVSKGQPLPPLHYWGGRSVVKSEKKKNASINLADPIGDSDTSVSFAVAYENEQLLPDGRGCIYYDGVFHSFWNEGGSIEYSTAESLWSQVPELIATVVSSSRLKSAAVAGSVLVCLASFFWRLNRSPLPTLERSYFAQYLEKSPIAKKYPLYVEHLRSLKM